LFNNSVINRQITKIDKVILQKKVIDFLESKALEQSTAFRRETDVKSSIEEA